MTSYPIDPPLSCDVLMKGGITSGVIYPHAVCELARTYRLRSVGGSSAGAIAAAAAAAAEVDRAGGGYERLEKLPDDITAPLPGGASVLFRLFQPQKATAAMFRAFTAGLGHSGLGRVARTVWAAVTGFLPWALVGALPGVALLVIGITREGPAAIVGGILVLIGGVVVGVALGVVRALVRDLPANGFGLCGGMPGVRSGKAEALTPWLHRTIQELAGRPAGAPPLCFADLDEAGVELRMMTTNLTRRQPTRMPWPDREYFFDPETFRRYFPAEVVDWMSRPEHAPEPNGGAARVWQTRLLRAQALPLLPFPAAQHLPVVVATRMSLSFPVLIAAVPLYAADFSTPSNQKSREAARQWRSKNPDGLVEEAAAELRPPAFEVNWFSDGGIASNLPVHFFDTPLPTRPTFAVDLAPFPVGQTKSDDELLNSYLPDVNQGGLHRRWIRWDTQGLGSVIAFGRSIVDTARSWVDQSQLVMPGYRDRIVTIYHDKAEGGMNLTMDREVVQDLVTRGRGGASKLVSRFAYDGGWDNHRWIRFRTATTGLDGWLAGFDRGYQFPTPSGLQYKQLAGGGADAPMPSYELTQKRRDAVNRRTDALLTLAAEWRRDPEDAFTFGAPSPRPVLRLVPGEMLDRPVSS